MQYGTKVPDQCPGSSVRIHMQTICLSHSPSIFPLFMLHGDQRWLQIPCHFFHRTSSLLAALIGGGDGVGGVALHTLCDILTKRIWQKSLCDISLRSWQLPFPVS